MYCFSFFFNDTATTEIYTLSLHDALPISPLVEAGAHLRHPSGSRNAAEPQARGLRGSRCRSERGGRKGGKRGRCARKEGASRPDRGPRPRGGASERSSPRGSLPVLGPW